MKSVRKITSLILIGVLAIYCGGCNMIQKTPEAINKQVVAKFSGEKITKGELDSTPEVVSITNQYKAQYGDNFEEDESVAEQFKAFKEEVLDNLILNKIILKKADELKVVKDEEQLKKDVEEQYEQIKSVYTDEDGNFDEEKFNEALKQSGLTEEKFKEYIRTQLVASMVYDEVTKDVKATSEEIKSYYDSHMLDYTEKPNRVHVAHILVKTEEEAKKVKERLDNGEDFAKVAKEVSIDTVANENGGDLGFINYNDPNYDQTFMIAAQALKDGEISEPINTQFGWHIIKCIKNEQYPVKKLEEVKDDVEKQVIDQKKNEKLTETIQQWKEDADIKIYEKNF